MYVGSDDRRFTKFITNTKESKWCNDGSCEKRDVNKSNTYSAKFHDMISHPQIFNSTLKIVKKKKMVVVLVVVCCFGLFLVYFLQVRLKHK